MTRPTCTVKTSQETTSSSELIEECLGCNGHVTQALAVAVALARFLSAKAEALKIAVRQ
jgi:hypothetical protein